MPQISVSRTGVAEVGRTERSGNDLIKLALFTATTCKQQDLFYKYSLDFAHLLSVWISLPTVMKDFLFHNFCQDLWEKSQTFIKTFWCRPQVYVCYMLISSRCLALKTRHTSSKLLHYLVVGSCQDCHTHTFSFSHIQETALRTFDSSKKSTHNGQDNFTVKVIAVHTDSIDYWLFRLIVQWAQFYFIFMILFIVVCQISSASFII